MTAIPLAAPRAGPAAARCPRCHGPLVEADGTDGGTCPDCGVLVHSGPYRAEVVAAECRVCGRMVSLRAAACPECGEPRRSTAAWLIGGVWALVGLLAILLMQLWPLGRMARGLLR